MHRASEVGSDVRPLLAWSTSISRGIIYGVSASAYDRIVAATSPPVTLDFIDAQEKRFASAFEANEIAQARDLYHPEVIYRSPTSRLFNWPSRIEGVEATLQFIQLTITHCRNIRYRLDERAVLPEEAGAFTRIVFDWETKAARLRSIYVVIYRYRAGRICQQEVYYDPSEPPELLGSHV